MTFYTTPGYQLPKPMPLAASCYHSMVARVRIGMGEWRINDWFTGRRQVESLLMQAIEAKNPSLHSDVNAQYDVYICECLHLLIYSTATDGGYVLGDPEVTFIRYLADPNIYQKFREFDKDGRVTAWLCVHAASMNGDTTNNDIEAHEIAADLNRLVVNLTGRPLDNPAVPTKRDVLNKLFSPIFWDLYVTNFNNETDPERLIWEQGLAPDTGRSSVALGKSELPNDFSTEIG